MSEESAFLRAIHDSPDDQHLRLVYADYLEERHDFVSILRAEFLRLRHELYHLHVGLVGPRAKFIRTMPEAVRLRMRQRAGVSERRQAEIILRLDYLNYLVGDEWWMMLDTARSQNCGIHRFQCPKQWHQLEWTNIATIRHCGECFQDVHYTRTITEAQALVSTGKCIALDTRDGTVAIAEALSSADDDELDGTPTSRGK